MATFLKKQHTTILLVAILMFIYLTPLLPIHQYYGLIILAFASFIAILSAWQKRWVDAVIALVIGLAYAFTPIIFSDTFENNPLLVILRTSSTLALIFFSITLLIGPWTHFSKLIRKLYKHRRHLGVTTLLLALFHEYLVLQEYLNFNLFRVFELGNFVFFGSTALMILIIMGVTSWNKIQGGIKTKSWILVHFGFLGFYLIFVGGFYNLAETVETWQTAAIVSFIIFWLALAPPLLPKLILRRVNGWKQLHLLGYVAYIAIIIHAWSGVIYKLDLWVQVAFWLLAFFVIGSHLVGRIIQLQKFFSQRSKQKEKSLK